VEVLALVGAEMAKLTGDQRFNDYWKFVRENRTDVYLQRVLDHSTNTKGYKFTDLEAKALAGVPALMNSRTTPKVVGYEQVVDSMPWYTKSGRLEFYREEKEFIEAGENLPVHREPVDSTFYEPNIIIAPPHEALRPDGPEKYGVKRDDLSCETRCGRNVVYTWAEAKKTAHPLMKDGFKFIFWWEWAHRLVGRLIGVVFLLPYLWFLLRGRLRGALAAKVFGFFVLGGLQGAMGWYMVKSGLVDDPRVSHYRLTAHLSLAFLLFASMFWVALGLLDERRRADDDRDLHALQRAGFWLAILVGYMAVTGGFVAGIRAGKAYNSFPLMNGHLLPPESFLIDPWYLNFFNNMALVQFDHRLGAWLLTVGAPFP